ncbi:MAG: ATP-binding protein [Treponema sp.]|nr:ATP-binding protein [Treponema sp.]MBR5401627.1 ATP-binding protein [Treponema sp.]
MFRKIKAYISDFLKSDTQKVLIIDGARQVGKSYIIREAGTELFENYVEINLLEDSLNNRYFANTKSTSDFYLQLSMIAGDRLKEKENTLIFLDEIQAYPHLLTLLKFLNQDNRFTYIASGSLLGITLSQTSSIPMGSIEVKQMYPMDFEEFLIANNFGELAISALKEKFKKRETLEENIHNNLLGLFKKYLLSGGLPDAVKTFVETNNIVSVRTIQNQIHEYYGMDASKYDLEHKLKIKRIYDMIPSTLENKKKRIVVQDIENKKGKRFSSYQDEFDYLINAGVALEVKAISTPVFPLNEHSGKNLLKLYLNDVGILSGILYQNNIRAILDSENSINLGTLYEAVVAQELKAHGKQLFYYDNKSKGEVDFLINDYDSLSILPIEVKSGKDYSVHSALNSFLQNKDYNVSNAIVFSNERIVTTTPAGITYLPIYYVMGL